MEFTSLEDLKNQILRDFENYFIIDKKDKDKEVFYCDEIPIMISINYKGIHKTVDIELRRSISLWVKENILNINIPHKEVCFMCYFDKVNSVQIETYESKITYWPKRE